MNLYSETVRSFKTDPGGFSGRKISAALALIWAAYLSDKLESDNRLYAVFAFLIFSAVCLGLVTIPELIKFLKSAKGGGGSFTKETVETHTVKEEKKEPEV